MLVLILVEHRQIELKLYLNSLTFFLVRKGNSVLVNVNIELSVDHQ